MNREHNVVCVGDLMAEYLVPVTFLPRADSTLIVDSVKPQLGGGAYNICWYLAQLGIAVRLVAPASPRDFFLIKEAFDLARLDTDGLIEAASSGLDVLIALLKDRHHRSIYLRTKLTGDTIEKVYANCRNADVLILSGSRHKTIRDAYCLFAKERRAKHLVFSPSYSIFEYEPEIFRKLILQADITILNRREAGHACRLLRLKNLRALSASAPRILIVTKGAKGAWISESGTTLNFPGSAKTNSPGIGAGDAFLAAFLFSRLQKQSLSEAGSFASQLAAIVVESGDVRIPVRKSEIYHRLRSQKVSRVNG